MGRQNQGDKAPPSGRLLGAFLWRAAFVTAAAALVLQTSAESAQAAVARCHPAAARATSVQGTVQVKRAGGSSQWLAVRLHETFCPGDVIRVLEHSRADVMLSNQSVLRLNANASITVRAPRARHTAFIDLLRGAAHFFDAQGPKSLEVHTPFTVAGVRGTEFFVDVEPKRTLLTVFEGAVLAHNRFGSLTLSSGQSAVAQAGKAPALRIVLHPRDAVQWTLYYPPVVYFRPGEVPTGARLDTYRAQRLLAVGSVNQARTEIARALELAPNNANALSLEAVMTLVQGKKDRAFAIAQKAVQVAPNSATARIALSYTQQARFDLRDARASVQRAVKLAPRNALAWARLAELDSSFGEQQKAIAAAQRAVELQPKLSLAQTVLGFAELTAINLRQAKHSFEKAIALNQADPLPRLGLGLAKIRSGHLKAGGRELEIAASLDPGNSLVRSYLGKTYYEEKRTTRAEEEYAVAKKLDPKDPTPWFYNAIANQTTNRPVQALHDLDKAQKLNDNRAVYRSKLLLDSDAASRAASQARVYTDLGFQQRALVDGWLAVNLDPTNFSAHRFLADSYGALPNHEIARVSELLQSQLLAPATNTPLQPQLAESNLLLISAGGPGVASFNEFNPLFNQNGVNALLTGEVGNHGTVGTEAVVSGLYNRLALSAGYSRFSTNGFRPNADETDKVSNLFAQYDISPDTSVQAEVRHRGLEYGDLAQNFSPSIFHLGERNSVQTDTYRIGIRHSFSPSSTLLGSFMYQNYHGDLWYDQLSLVFPYTLLDVATPEDAASGEVQDIYRSPKFNLVSGFGYFDIRGAIDQTIGINPFVLPPGAPNTFITNAITNTHHLDAYTYGTFKPIETVALTAGLSYDSVNSAALSIGHKHSLNPKLGLIWNPTPQTTVRAGVFKTLKRTLITDQTLEPTQVAGFNQFYDEPNATEAWRYGFGVDHRIGRDVFLGGEISKRAIRQPFTYSTPTTSEVATQHIDDYRGRGYAFWTPNDRTALSGQVLMERQRTKDYANLTSTPTKLDTIRVPLGVRVFMPSGFGAQLTESYVNQKAAFYGGVNNGTSRFWVLDASMSYRLPDRRGSLSVGATNLLDRHFKYYTTDPLNPAVEPVCMVFARVTIVLQ